IDLPQLETRVVRAENLLKAAHKALDTLVKTGVAADSESLRTALMKLNAFSIQLTIPVVASGDEPATRATLLMQATAVLKESKLRVDRVTALGTAAAATDPKQRRDQLQERARAVFGASFVVVPQFTFDQAAELASAMGASTQLQGGDP